MERSASIYIAGHRGMVGSAIVRNLKQEGYNRLIMRSSEELDLRVQKEVEKFFSQKKPDYVILAAAKVGGIQASNTFRADFIYDNLMIETNVIRCAHQSGVKKLLFLGSSCIYPKMAPQPLKEDYLLSGYLEETNEPYAIAKIAGIKLCEAFRDQYGCNFISAMPTNLYGPNDNYNLKTSHVLPALLRKYHTAKVERRDEVELWGTGNPRREFMHVDDLADAALFLMNNYNEKQFVNIGTGSDITIRELAEVIAEVTGFQGETLWDTSMPDGTAQKLLDVSFLHSLGWRHSIQLLQGIESVYSEIKSMKYFD